jgi:hypothetical protein
MFRRGVPKEAIRRLLGHHSWDFTASGNPEPTSTLAGEARTQVVWDGKDG